MRTQTPAGQAAWSFHLLAAIVLLGCAFTTPTMAQAPEAQPASASGLPAEVSAALDADLARMQTLGDSIKRLDAELASAEGLRLQVLEARLARYWNDLVNMAHAFAQRTLKLTEEGQDVAEYRAVVESVLSRAPAALFAEIDRTAAGMVLPTPEQSAAEQAAVDARAGIAIERVTELYRALIKNNGLAREFGLSTEVVDIELNARLEEQAASLSAYLDIAMDESRAARAQLAALPADADIGARLAVAESRVKQSAAALQTLSTLMVQQELDTSVYDAQLIATTGAITTDIFDLSVLRDLAGNWLGSMLDWLQENGASMIFSLLVFLVIVYAAFKLANIVQRLINKALSSSRVQISQLLQRMIVSAARGIVIAVGLLIALSQIGISLGPLLAGLGIAGFVIGFALQDSLSNFASGMMILLYRPFDVGDLVEVGDGVFGTVSAMSLVNTTVLTVDNQTLVVPNNSIWQNVIKNVTAQRTRRIDLVFGIGYSDDIPRAEQILTAIVTSHELVLKDPEPVVRLHELADSSVNFVVRPWVKTDDYWDVYWDITREVKMRFDAEGVSIPFPQRDVHLFTEAPLVAATAEPAAAARTATPHRKEFDSAGTAGDDD